MCGAGFECWFGFGSLWLAGAECGELSVCDCVLREGSLLLVVRELFDSVFEGGMNERNPSLDLLPAGDEARASFGDMAGA